MKQQTDPRLEHIEIKVSEEVIPTESLYRRLCEILELVRDLSDGENAL